MTDHDFMNEAVKLAFNALQYKTGGPFGAIVVKDNKIIGRGYNQVLANNDPTAHAEVTAIRDACKTIDNFWLNDCVIYTSCEPCPMCLGAIYWSRITKIYYGANRQDAASIGFDDNFFYEELEKTFSQRLIPMIPINREQSLQPFNEWQTTLEKTPY